jgi:putative spermidine/putrescine transport system substrate-binding protein
VKPAPTSWSALYSSKYKGKITVPNNPIQIADGALYLMETKPSLGIKDPYELTSSQLAAVVTLLKKQKPLIKKYWNSATDEINLFKGGDAIIGASWPYQTLTLQAAKQPIKEIIPRYGATGWADTWMLAAKAPHPNCAYLWMKYVTTPQVEAKQALVFGETPVNPKACPYMNKMQKGSCAKYHLNQPLSFYKKIHFWKTPIPDCGNGQKNCMDNNAWQRAWTQITG